MNRPGLRVLCLRAVPASRRGVRTRPAAGEPLPARWMRRWSCAREWYITVCLHRSQWWKAQDGWMRGRRSAGSGADAHADAAPAFVPRGAHPHTLPASPVSAASSFAHYEREREHTPGYGPTPTAQQTFVLPPLSTTVQYALLPVA